MRVGTCVVCEWVRAVGGGGGCGVGGEAGCEGVVWRLRLCV